MLHTTTIARTDVRDALRHLSRDRTPGPTPLSSLLLVERAVARSGMRLSKGAREYELARLLSETVEAELARLRRTLRSGRTGDDADAVAVLRRDFAEGHRELESWSAKIGPGAGKGLDFTEAVVDGLIRIIEPFNDYIDTIINMIDIEAIKRRKLKILLYPID